MNKYILVTFFFFTAFQTHAQLYESGDEVGIGINPPVGKLDVAGLTYLRAAPTYSVEYEQLRIGRSDSDIRYHSLLSSHNGNGHQNYLKFLVHSGGSVAPFTDQTTVMTLLGNGNVGIGTTTPDSKLSVNGNIRAHEIKLETSNWPDYVFGENYRQLSLEEVKTFIKEHGHLPGLQSAEVYQKEGVNMMEMNRKLVEKIEEMTLYLIEKDREVNALQHSTEETLASLRLGEKKIEELTLHTISQEESLKRKEGEIAEMKKRLDKIEKLMDLARDE